MHPIHIAASTLAYAMLAVAQYEPPIIVHFPRGATSTTVSGTLIGDGTAQYAVQVQPGQSIQLKLTASDDAMLNLYAPGEDTAMHIDGDRQRFSGLLAVPGTYRIQISQPRPQVHRDAITRYTLSIALR